MLFDRPYTPLYHERSTVPSIKRAITSSELWRLQMTREGDAKWSTKFYNTILRYIIDFPWEQSGRKCIVVVADQMRKLLGTV